jgi:hypothetical protein
MAPITIRRIMDTQTTDKKKKVKESLKYQRDKDRQMVKGIFRFYEVPGGSMSFNFRKYKEDPIERYDFRDGEIYTIPLGVAKHLTQNGSYPVHKYMKDSEGNVSMRVGQKVNRFGFESLEFMDIDDLPNASSEIVTVDNVKDDKIFRRPK